MRPTTDKDALVASQIAYMNIEEKDIRDAKKEYGSATLENISKYLTTILKNSILIEYMEIKIPKRQN